MFCQIRFCAETLVVGGIDGWVIRTRVAGGTSPIFVTVFLIRVGNTNAVINAIRNSVLVCIRTCCVFAAQDTTIGLMVMCDGVCLADSSWVLWDLTIPSISLDIAAEVVTEIIEGRANVSTRDFGAIVSTTKDVI
jgi:hypothetical protein